MANLIDRDALLVVPHVHKVVEYDESGEFITFNAVSVEDIEKAHAIDAVPVVRCAECEFYGPNPFHNPLIGWCRILGEPQKPNFYCANGKRKEEK